MARFYVVFRDSDHRGWWQALTRPGYEHVAAMTEAGYSIDGQPVTLAINPSMTALEVAMIVAPALEAARQCAAGGRVLAIDTPMSGYQLPRRWAIMNCSTAVAWFLGLPVWAPTPYWLYRRLRAMGAEEV